MILAGVLLAGALLPVVPQDQKQWGQKNSCGTTSLAAICEYYRPGAPENDRHRLDAYLLHGEVGTAPDELARWAEHHGYRTAIKTGATVADLVDAIDKGVPVQALIDRGPRSDGDIHYLVVSGYETDPAGRVTHLILADSWEYATLRVETAEFDRKWSDLALWGIPIGIDRLIVTYLPDGGSERLPELGSANHPEGGSANQLEGGSSDQPAARSIDLPANGHWDFADTSQPARVAGKAFMNVLNGWALGDPARVCAGIVQGTGAAVGYSLYFPGSTLMVLDGPPETIGIFLTTTGALAAWGLGKLGDALRIAENGGL